MWSCVCASWVGGRAGSAVGVGAGGVDVDGIDAVADRCAGGWLLAVPSCHRVSLLKLEAEEDVVPVMLLLSSSGRFRVCCCRCGPCVLACRCRDVPISSLTVDDGGL